MKSEHLNTCVIRERGGVVDAEFVAERFVLFWNAEHDDTNPSGGKGQGCLTQCV